jgi:hypothetical protein
MTDRNGAVERIPRGTRWPSGDGRDAALLDIDAAELSHRLGFALDSGEEDGLGPWHGTGLRLSSGIHVGLIEHRFAPKRGFLLQVDLGADPSTAVDETLAALGLSRDTLLWLSPLIASRD